MSKFVTAIRGRLGNALFEIAAGKYYADNNNLDFYINEDINQDKNQLLHSSISLFNFNTSDINNCINISQNLHSLVYKEFPKFKEFNQDVYCDKYCQTPKYWNNDRQWCINLFKQDEIISYIKSIFNLDFNKYVSIHIRRTDYLKVSWAKMPSISFYKECMRFFNKHQKFIIFSDDIIWCKKQFKKYNNVIYLNTKNKKYNEDILDLYIQTLCKANIISNSTFSWWGAYLNIHKDRKVYWNGPWWKDFSGDIIPENDNWINIQ